MAELLFLDADILARQHLQELVNRLAASGGFAH
jgi:hypothetical protein